MSDRKTRDGSVECEQHTACGERPSEGPEGPNARPDLRLQGGCAGQKGAAAPVFWLHLRRALRPTWAMGVEASVEMGSEERRAVSSLSQRDLWEAG